MKKWKIVLMAGMTAMVTGCSPKTESVETTAAVPIVIETESKTTEAETKAAEEKTEEKAQTEAVRDDNFAVEEAEAEAFAASVKEAVEGQNLEMLADLAAFPLYVGFSDGGVSVKSKEEFLALGAEKIFTEELLEAVAQADGKNLPPSRTGFVLTKENGKTNIIFGLREGKLAISGINY